ncbi:MAG: prolyl oligopeptidase family serine peptidase [Planctomycetaceae bacterium]
MERDLRDTPRYRDVEAFYRAALEPGFGVPTAFGDPIPSPDKTRVAFVGQVLEKLDGAPQGRICLAAADGSGWRTITNGPNTDDDPRWSPDGTRLTFRSDRGERGRFQLYELRAGEVGEARPLAAIPGVVEHHRWSPDGASILVVVAGGHAEQADALGSGTLGAGEDDAPWLPEVESFEDEQEWRRLWIVDVASGEARRVSRDGLNVWEAAWVGNGTIAAIVSEGPSEGDWYTAPLALLDLTTGDEQVLYRSAVQLGYVEGSPDGSVVAVIEAVCSDRYLVAGDLLLVALDGEVRRVDAGGADVTCARWRADGSLLAFGRARLDSVVLEVRDGVVHELARTPRTLGGHGPAGAPLGDGAVAAVSGFRRPPAAVVLAGGREVVLADASHEGHERLATHLGAVEALTWTAPDGLEIDGYLLTPHGTGPFPLLLNVHGGPVWQFGDQWPGLLTFLLLSRGYAILEPNPRGSTGRGQGFAGMVVGDMGGADAADVLAGLEAVVARGVADPERIGVFGGSYGGFMAAWLPAIDGRFKAAVALSPVTDWFSEHFDSSLTRWVGDFLGDVPERADGQHHARSPVFAGERLRTPTLLTAGARDRATPPGQAVEHYRSLRAQGVAAEVVLYPQEGHGVRTFPAAIDLATRTLVWFERFLPA